MNELMRRLLFLPPQRSSVAQQIDGLHYLVISVTMLGSLIVFALAAYFAVRYRAPPDIRKLPDIRAVRGESLMLEGGLLLGLFALFLVFWVIGSRQFVRLRLAPEGALEVYVTAKQWMWKFAYPNGKRSIEAVYVPVGRPIRLVMTSRDVIHSFYVPDFRVKHDVLPGRYTTVWFEATQPGKYDILCAEYCGTEHSRMRGMVVALEPSAYQAWLEDRPFEEPQEADSEEAPPSRSDHMVNEGQRVASTEGCLRCHSVDGSAHLGPTWAGLYESRVRLQTGEEVVADVGYLTESMMDPQAKLHAGYPPIMPSYFGKLRAEDTAALVEFIRSLRDVARPGDVDPGPVGDAGWVAP